MFLPTLDGARMHSTKLLEVRPNMRKKVMDYIIPRRREIIMLNLQTTNLASNKENLPLALDSQEEDQHHN
jgi:hypothetical protein